MARSDHQSVAPSARHTAISSRVLRVVSDFRRMLASQSNSEALQGMAV